MKLLTIENLSSQAVTERDFDTLPTAEYSKFKSKDAFVAWSTQPTTKHAFVSAVEGLDGTRRVSNENPAFSIRAFIADYDEVEADEKDEVIAEKVRKRSAVCPNIMYRTFSGGVRLVWFFEKPVIMSPEIVRRFLKQLCSELGASKLLQGLDKAAVLDSSKYYEPGTSRMTLAKSPLSSNMINHLLWEVSSKVDWGAMAEVVNIELVAAAVETRFPGKWTGPFTIGSRGPRFWDDTADNPTAAIVRESGMQCFTGMQPFVPWAQILGSAFVRETEESRISKAIDDVYFDGSKYWMASKQGWNNYARIDIMTHFRVGGLESNECDAALVSIQKHKRVAFAAPLAFYPHGIVPLMGKRVINTFQCRTIEPAKDESDWGARFPLLAEYLGGFFEKVDNSDKQLVHFLAWLRRFYLSCHQRMPQPGQVLFIAGDVGLGKTFLSNVLMNRIFGGSADVSSFLLGESRFSGHLFNVALWTVDDTRPGHDAVHAKYSAMLKKIPANQLFLYDEKYERACMIPWLGRIMVSCNLDAESLRSIPDVEHSLLDKIMILKAAAREFFDFPALVKVLDDELPHFLKWLEDWDPSEEDDSVIEASRYGVTAYHHPELLQSAREVTESHSFLEVLNLFISEWRETTDDENWRGTPTHLLRILAMDDSMKPLINGLSSRTIGRRLSQLKNQGIPLGYERENGARIWVIPRDIDKRTCENLTPHDEGRKTK